LLFVENLHHLNFDLLLFYSQPVLVPNEIWLLWVKMISLQSILEKPDNVSIVWILGETKSPAVVHKLLELVRLVLAELLDGDLFLLLLDGGVFLLLGATRKTLPWERAFKEVEKDVSNSL
jgi:hypothetical protein